MLRYYQLVVILFLFCFIACNKDKTPLGIEQEIIPPLNIQGFEIEFSDTCSYSFIITFLSSFDSIRITSTFLGNTYHFMADSGDKEYWHSYFENDSTIQSLFTYDTNDSLELKIRVTGERSSNEDLERFSTIKYLTLIEIEDPLYLVYIKVPKGTEYEWKRILSQYHFILQINMMGIAYP